MLNSWGFCKMSEVTSTHGSHEMIAHAFQHNLWSWEGNAARYQNSVNKAVISRPQLQGLDWWRHPGMWLTCLVCTIGPKNRHGETQQVIETKSASEKLACHSLISSWFLVQFCFCFAWIPHCFFNTNFILESIAHCLIMSNFFATTVLKSV